MIKGITSLILMTLFCGLSVHAQYLTPEQYIEKYKDIAIREMKRMGVPAAISLAQGLLETESGNSALVKKSNNHFGIKCKNSWTAGGVSHDDDAPGECFRVYKTADDSYRDHSNFLRGGERYSFLFQLDPTDYKGWAYGLKKAGYATNPKYPNILIKHIEQYNLQQYSLEAAGEVPKFESSKYKDDTVVFDKNETVKGEEQQGVDNLTVPGDNKNDQADLFLSAASDNVSFINGSKCVVGKKGTSLLALASRHSINLQKLLDINDLETDGILEENQIIFLQKKSKTGDQDFIIVQKNETLYDVAQRNGIQLESLLEYNHLTEDGDVTRGSKLYMRDMSVAAKAGQTKNKPGKQILYEVQPKESLYVVAKKYSVTVQQLKEWNNLTTDELKIGQQLIVGR